MSRTAGAGQQIGSNVGPGGLGEGAASAQPHADTQQVPTGPAHHADCRPSLWSSLSAEEDPTLEGARLGSVSREGPALRRQTGPAAARRLWAPTLCLGRTASPWLRRPHRGHTEPLTPSSGVGAPHAGAQVRTRVHTCTHTRPGTTHSPCSPMAETRGGRYQAALPWSKPVRMREKVMKTRWALPSRASSGVAAVMTPQAEADSRMTFSPPILEDDRRTVTGAVQPGGQAGREDPARGNQGPSLLRAAPGWARLPCPPLPKRWAVGAQLSLSVCPNKHPTGLPGVPQGAGHLPPSDRHPHGARLSQVMSCLGGALPHTHSAGAASPEGGPALHGGQCCSPVPQVAAHHLRQAVAPEEAAEHDAGLLLVPAEILAHGDGAHGHADAGRVQQAGAQQQCPCPHLAFGPAGQKGLCQARRGGMDTFKHLVPLSVAPRAQADTGNKPLAAA